MKVLITGGTGSVGKAATERLVRSGWDVLVVGRRSGIEIAGAEYAVCDVTGYDGLREKMRGCDAVVHLAAIANPGRNPGPEVMRVNVLGTFNVFEAAAKEGVRRIVQASSINAFGCFYGLGDLDHVRYFPIDEEHPSYTTDPYSFSKEVIENVGDYYWRREGISSVALRLPWVHPREHGTGEDHRRELAGTRAVLDEMAALPEAEWLARLAAAREKAVAFRRQRPLEYGGKRRGARRGGRKDDPLCGIYFGARANFWTFVDERDSAQAIEKGLTAEYEGSHVLFINDSHNWLLYETEKLLGLFFPEVTGRKRPIRGCESLVSIDKARALIGFQPEHSIARLLADKPAGPCP
jgi:nucleoside-diphosphate-sugar epimerase